MCRPSPGWRKRSVSNSNTGSSLPGFAEELGFDGNVAVMPSEALSSAGRTVSGPSTRGMILAGAETGGRCSFRERNKRDRGMPTARLTKPKMPNGSQFMSFASVVADEVLSGVGRGDVGTSTFGAGGAGTGSTLGSASTAGSGNRFSAFLSGFLEVAGFGAVVSRARAAYRTPIPGS